MAGSLEPKLETKLDALLRRCEELQQSLSDPDVAADRDKFRSLGRAYAEVEPVAERYREYRRARRDLAGAQEILRGSDEAEMREMAGAEVRALEGRVEELEQDLRRLLMPQDPNDARNSILEIRAGAGGNEASLFAAELFRMYRRYAETRGWRVRTTDVSESSVGGVKEIIAVVEGEGVFSRLKFERGVHRVQRVPETESQGRIHTSAVTVAVLPEAEEVEVEIEDKDLRIDTFCSSGPGGQSVNTTQSAVRITHLPSGIVVQCQDEKSWHKNKARALQVLRSRLYDKMLREQQEAIAEERRTMVGSGDRAEKIRTYNFPQSRITDHRVGLTVHNLDSVLDGNLDEIIDALANHDRAERLKDQVQA